MSFRFDEFDTAGAGVLATLRRMPSLQGLTVETIDAPGTDGVILGGTSRSKAQFVFDVIVDEGSADAAGAKRDTVAAALDPARGQRWLSFDAAPGWRWLGILSAPVEWERVSWDAGAGFKLRADVTFDCLEAYGRPVEEESWAYPGPGSWPVVREKGNAASFPTVEVEGRLSSSQAVTVTVGDVQVVVPGPLLAGEVLRLDWDQYDFARWAGNTKVASVVRGMSTLDRPVLWPGQEAAFAVATSGSVSAVRLVGNSRRQ